MIKNLYKQDLMDHYQNPHNFGAPERYTHVSERLNPACGDKIQFFAVLEGGCIQDIRFTGAGCVLSIAAASKLSQVVKGQSLDFVLNLDAQYMQDLVGMQIGFSSMQCILLSLQALISALKKVD